MERAESKAEYIVRAKDSMRNYLRAKSWPEKIRSIERMNRATRLAREGMKRTLAERLK